MPTWWSEWLMCDVMRLLHTSRHPHPRAQRSRVLGRTRRKRVLTRESCIGDWRRWCSNVRAARRYMSQSPVPCDAVLSSESTTLSSGYKHRAAVILEGPEMAGEHLLMSTMCRCAHQSQRRCRARKSTCCATWQPFLNLSSSLHLNGHASGGAGAGSLGPGADSVTTRAGSGGFEMRCCDLW
jgi:hypothetical protein